MPRGVQLFVVTVTLTLLTWPSFVLMQESCFTPNGSSGYCVAPNDCQYVRDLSAKYGRFFPVSVKRQLMLVRCNTSDRRTMMLCCASESVLIPIATQSDSPRPHAATSNNFGSQSNVDSRAGPAPPGLNRPADSKRIDQRGLRVLEGVNECGKKPVIKVSGGEETKIGEFPWLALLKYNRPDRPFACGGSLITDRYVLTAAHCVVKTASKLIGVRLGEHNLDKEEDCQYRGRQRVCLPPYQEYGIDIVKPHPGYNGSINNDIALIKLDRTVHEDVHIKPICLPINQPSRNVNRDQSFFIAGWGYSELDRNDASSVLRKALVKRQELDVCRNYYESAPVTENHICATGSGIMQTCRGDSGGPLFFLNSFLETARYVQYGIVSFGGRNCGRFAEQPGIYSNIIDLLPWITQNID